MPKIEIEMLNALAAYSGRVKRCPPGKARGADLPKKEGRNRNWLNGHCNDVTVRDDKAERRRQRMARAERARIAKRNAFVRECHRLND
jgi:hypothetical protein